MGLSVDRGLYLIPKVVVPLTLGSVYNLMQLDVTPLEISIHLELATNVKAVKETT